MSYQEYLCRCETKHCYHCGGPLVAGYKCPKKNLRFLILAEDEWINNEGEITRLEGELENTFDNIEKNRLSVNGWTYQFAQLVDLLNHK